MPKINEMLLNWEGFEYATPIDVIMGYYHILLIKNSSNLCTIILPWENIFTRVYQKELLTHKKFYNKR